VIAAVAAGLYAGSRAFDVSAADTRLQLRAFWDLLVFLLNALLFLLIGIQVPLIVDGLGHEGVTAGLLGETALVALATFAIRMLWMFTVPALVGAFGRGGDEDPPEEQRAERVVLGWSAMRGGLSLALALALPLTASGKPFPDRPTIVFIAYGVVLVTLVLPGLTLGPLVKRLGIETVRQRQRQRAEARASVTHAAIARIEQLAADDKVQEDAAERLRGVYEARLARLTGVMAEDPDERDEAHRARRLRRAAIEAQREELEQLRARHQFPEEVLREIEHELDLDESRAR
jgi:CPA1 family monovalent cation:H+ antiporter